MSGFTPCVSGASRGEGKIVDDRIEQRLHTLVLERGAYNDREQFQGNGRFAQRGAQLFGGNRFAFEKLVQDFVVVLGDGLDQLGMERLGLFLHIGRDFFGLVLRAHCLVFPDDGLHLDQVDDADKLRFLADGDLNRDGPCIEALADGVDGMLEISTHLVDLVDETNSRDAVFISLAPDFFRLRLHAMNGVEYSDSAVEHAQRSLDLGREVDVAGGINNVDADVAPGAGRGGGGDSDAALLLLLHPVHRGRAFVDLADAVRPARIKQDALGRSGLPGVDVRHDADVSAPL